MDILLYILLIYITVLKFEIILNITSSHLCTDKKNHPIIDFNTKNALLEIVFFNCMNNVIKTCVMIIKHIKTNTYNYCTCNML